MLQDIPLESLADPPPPNCSTSARLTCRRRCGRSFWSVPQGNPLALVELPKAVQGVTAQMDDLPLTQRLEDAFSARTDSVSRGCRTLLLVLAAEPTAPLNLLLDLSSRISGSAVSVDAVQEAVDADLVTLVGYTAEFRHPLMRTAIYTHATLADRLATHRALASVMGDTPERQLAHEAAATIGPDEELAARLERFADVSQARGKAAAASPGAASGGRPCPRYTAPDRHPGPGGRVVQRDQPPHQRPDAAGPHGHEHAGPGGAGSPHGGVRQVLRLEPGEPQRRIQEMVTAAAGAFDAGAGDVAENLLLASQRAVFLRGRRSAGACQAAAELDRWNPDPNAPHVLAVRAYTEPFRHGADVIARLGGIRADHQDGRMLHFLGSGAMVIGDIGRATQYLALATAAWRSQGRLGLLARSLAASGRRCTSVS